MATAGDPDIITDFIVPANVTTIDGNFFTFTGMRALVKSGPPTNTTTFTAWKAGLAEFQALNGQSVSYDVLYFPAGSINPPHTRVRPTGLLFLLQGIDDIVLAKSFKTEVATIQALKATLAPKP
uniref:Cupin type-1 domain-containing protein n=1 Tax=Fagus sylvatica TaxID=28930 RepID=A0A2N9G2M8_FAGSY